MIGASIRQKETSDAVLAHIKEESEKDEKNTRSQSDRFKRTARDLGVDLDEAKLAETLRRVAKHDPEKKKDSKGD